MNIAISASYNMPLDMARRTMVQRQPLAPTANAGRVLALSAIVPEVRELARGFDFSAEDAREALVAQQIMASADIWSISQGMDSADRAGMAMASHQTMAKAIAASGDLSDGSVVRRALDELPAGLRSVVSLDEMNLERSKMRPS